MFAIFSIYACLTRCVLMECRSLTFQSTSGSGDPDPLQLTVTLSPSTTKTLLWLTLISGKSENIHVDTYTHVNARLSPSVSTYFHTKSINHFSLML